MEDQVKNGLVIVDFKRFWGAAVKSTPTSMTRFSCRVTFSFFKGELSDTTCCRIKSSGLDANKIALDETQKLLALWLHMEFNPSFQKYSLSKRNRYLVISGNSEKMGGDYKVTIRPIQAVDF
ncbi:hypothetical protein ABQZ69_17780 [Xanthomonas sp. WHRI 8391]|uniref:hypothetical protein n=1 Tax=Xanthomonas sp. WHRI 8391 TaxID=3161573 RepID=UPI001A1EFCD6|nr:hypothetical protein [Xanthomonas hortorum pv. carotae]